MNKKAAYLMLLMFFTALILLPTCGIGKQSYQDIVTETNTWNNNIPPRKQWNHNFGYCGEVSLISAGLYYGQYISQYTARAIASKGTPQNKSKSQLLLGKNAQYTASQLHLNAIEWNANGRQDTTHFLAWVKRNVIQGYPVAIGVYTNEYLFYGNRNLHAGNPDYDHIVSVTGIGSSHPFTDSSYYSEDIIYFSDHGLWGKSSDPRFNFSYAFGAFQASRTQANTKNEFIYSLPNSGNNYGIAITGIRDLSGDTLPVRVDTDINNEKPEIKEGSNTCPRPMPLLLTITISELQPNVLYNLYRYNDLAVVPDSNFNAHACQANKSWQIQISTGATYVMTEQILSNEIAVYRAVKATAP